MRIDDACLVITDVDASDDFYSALGLQRRMRNVRFADFVLGDGPRLAMWLAPSIAETVGPSYPTGPGLPVRITLELASLAQDSIPHDVVDPDGFELVVRSSPNGTARLAEVELTVSDLHRTLGFLGAMGFGSPTSVNGATAVEAGAVRLLLRGKESAAVGAPGSGSTGRLMLAIELTTGEEVDALYEALRARGLVDSGPPALYEWGARSAYFVDHDGYIWEIYAWVEEPR